AAFVIAPTIPGATSLQFPPGKPSISHRETLIMRKIQIGNSAENVVERADYPPQRIKAILGSETVAVLGYGVQGRGQSLNMKDNGVNVVIGLRDTKGKSWDLAQQDGWVPGKTLLSLEDAVQRGTIIQYLLSDAGQKDQWPKLKPLFTK